MPDPTFEAVAGGYRITDGQREVPITAADFEDLYFAVPVSPSQMYRLLTDSCCKNDDHRLALRAMVEQSALGMNAALDKLQADIQALPDPTA